MDFLPINPSVGQKYKISNSVSYYYEWNGFAWETQLESSGGSTDKNAQKVVKEIINETPAGDINSVNNIFELISLPEENSETLYLNGLLQKRGLDYDYTINESTITFNIPPLDESIILCSYSTIDQLYNKNEEPSGSIDGSNSIFTLSKTPSIGYEKIYLNGLLQKYGPDYDYVISGSSIIFNEPPLENSTISCYYYSVI